MSAPEPTVAETLRAAAGVLRDRGWTTGGLVDNQGRVCAVGAIGVAVSPGCPMPSVTRDVVSAVPEPVAVVSRFLGLPEGYYQDPNIVPLADWNDLCATDGEQVAQVFEKAAAAWEETVGLDA